MSESDNAEEAACDGLLEAVLDDGNIAQALKRVVGNRGAPGTDGMSVQELAEWLPSNIDALKETIRAGKYRPSPVRRVEIPKPDGGTRSLGVPTAVDRLIQQAIAQVLTPIYEPTFSDSSFGFRPNRSAQDAILRAKGYMDEGYRYAVDLDLSKFFDTLNQDRLMTEVRKTVRDMRLTDLIKRFVKAGAVLPSGLTVRTDEGTPQGGPLSPLLANIYLDRFDKLMESRNLHFIRYADDIVVFVRTPRSAERVMESCIRFLEGNEMRLKVNRDKSSCGSTRGMKILGFELFTRKGDTFVSIHRKSLKRFKDRIRQITRRNRGRSLGQILAELRTYMRGWIGYFGIVTSRSMIEKLDSWIRRRVRQYIWKQWKTFGAKFTNLMGLCPPYYQCPDGRPDENWKLQCSAIAGSRAYWRISTHITLNRALGNRWLADQGMYFMMGDCKKTG
ncbi:MAG: group II intron reverse transcriptase/maturase [Thermoplasmata archaeon]|nr:group II intron reverse transcriptase/maturase [Thermoplasmata archaeon]